LLKLVFQTNTTRTDQTVYIEAAVEEITAVKVSRKTSIEIALEEAVSRVVDLIIDIIYYHRSFNKRSAIYIKNLDTGQQSILLMSENKYIINLINILNTLQLCITRAS
jgi:hypothetical protein